MYKITITAETLSNVNDVLDWLDAGEGLRELDFAFGVATEEVRSVNDCTFHVEQHGEDDDE